MTNKPDKPAAEQRRDQAMADFHRRMAKAYERFDKPAHAKAARKLETRVRNRHA